MKKLVLWTLVMVLILGVLPCHADVTSDEAEPSQKLTNILLIGEDTRQGEHSNSRADAIMVCSISAQGQVKLMSIMRDLWVEMDTGFADRINAAYRYGGPELLLKAVNQTLQMDITQYISINFYGFCDVVDIIGGVEIDLEPKAAGAINKKTKEKYGNVKAEPIPVGATRAVLSGAQALGYARIRELDSDMGRTGRQRRVLMGILEKVLTLSTSEQKAFFEHCLACVETNVEPITLFSLGLKILAHGMDDMEQIALPSAGNYYYVNHDGRSTYEFKKDVIVKDAYAFLYGTDEDAGNEAQ